jgi:hypothetical protein
MYKTGLDKNQIMYNREFFCIMYNPILIVHKSNFELSGQPHATLTIGAAMCTLTIGASACNPNYQGCRMQP